MRNVLLTDDQCYILDLLIEMEKNNSFSPGAFYRHFSVEQGKEEFYYCRIADACESLQRSGFFKSLEIDDSRSILGYKLTHEGYNYKKYNHLETKERWKERGWGFLSATAVAIIARLIEFLL